MKNMFWKILGATVITGIAANGVVNTVSRIRRNRLEDENYQEEIKRKKEERIAKEEARKEEKRLALEAKNSKKSQS